MKKIEKLLNEGPKYLADDGEVRQAFNWMYSLINEFYKYLEEKKKEELQ